jgi:N-methylhydantoinase A
VMRSEENTTQQDLSERFKGMESQSLRDLLKEGISRENLVKERYLDMRYEGQSYEIIVPFEGDYIENFHSLHEKSYGYRNPDKRVEIVNIRLRAREIPDKPRFQKLEKAEEMSPEDAFLGERRVVFDQTPTRTAVLARDRLLAGNRIKGPAVLVEYSSTIVIPPFATAWVDEYGNLVMEII